MKFPSLISLMLLVSSGLSSQENLRIVNVASGWSNTSVNTVIFRKNSLVTYKDTQFIAFYDQQQFLTLGKRKSGQEQWILQQSNYKGDVLDAHNSISIMVDGDGYLHISWNQHNVPINYCRSISAGSLTLTGKMTMTGLHEKSVTYPEFYKLKSGDLLFLYRDGESGKGNLVVNKYKTSTHSWTQLHHTLIDGASKRNAYWQACVDETGVLHISWVWRETPDVASNYDLCYAKSEDGGETWMNSRNKKYLLPITATSAEYAVHIPQQSELINQTSMVADGKGRVYIASYWKEGKNSVPQYHVIFYSGNEWKDMRLDFRRTAFTLTGTGTKRIPISRPELIVWKKGVGIKLGLIFRDAERKDRVSIAVCRDLLNCSWIIKDLTTDTVGAWEPSYDTDYG